MSFRHAILRTEEIGAKVFRGIAVAPAAHPPYWAKEQ